MASDLVLPDTIPIYRVWHVTDAPTDGAASVVARPPSFVWAKPGVLHARRFRDALRGLGLTQAAMYGRGLQRGEYVATSDIDVITAVSRAAHPQEEAHEDDCPSCLAALDQARAYLREKPDRILVAGVLYFLAEAPRG